MTVIEAITQAAKEYGIDPNLAIATAKVESGLNPQAVGDSGSSFGLFQLHRGGELGSMTPQQAFDPLTNARRALSEFAVVKRNFPNVSPGRMAALAQRPADPNGYAQKVEAALASLGGSASSAATSVTTAPLTGLAWLTGQLGVTNPSDIFVRGGFVVTGFILVAIGAYIMFANKTGGTGSNPQWQSHNHLRTATEK